eukprot:GHRR01019620.1.p1 GENE.GHRR01019620.1~~GHRR01019620.1.p1  ORF type:complete len:295 (+),score=56.85 GHRR01019620.1:1279-2163(+)
MAGSNRQSPALPVLLKQAHTGSLHELVFDRLLQLWLQHLHLQHLQHHQQALSPNPLDRADVDACCCCILLLPLGLGCRVHNAVLKTTDDGAAHDVFWVTDLRGRKLSDAVADEVAERLEEYVSYCAPPKLEGDFKEFHCGDISISNLLHPQWTQVSITADLFSPGLLLELSSLIHGQGLHICEAVVRSGSENPIPCSLVSNPDAIPEPLPGKRVMRFWLKEGRSGNKLDYADVNSLVYTLRLCLGGTSLPQKPPNSDLNSLACDSPNSSITKGSSGANGAGLVMGQATGPATVF